MKQYPLQGLDALGTPVKLATEVKTFENDTRYFSVTILDEKHVQLVTPKGCYQLTKHASANRFQGVANGHKVHVCLKKIVGQIIFW